MSLDQLASLTSRPHDLQWRAVASTTAGILYSADWKCAGDIAGRCVLPTNPTDSIVASKILTLLARMRMTVAFLR